MNVVCLGYIILMTICAYLFVKTKLQTAVERLGILLFFIFLSAYSGLGIATGKSDIFYIIPFTVFYFFLVLGLRISFGVTKRFGISKKTKSVDLFLDKYAFLGTIIYFSICILLLFYPENMISKTLSGKIGILVSPSSQSNNTLVRIINSVQYLLTPFIYISMAKSKKWYFPAIMQLGLIVISFFSGAGYFARSGLLSYLFVLVFVTITELQKKKNRNRQDGYGREYVRWKKYKRYLYIGIMFLVGAMPLLYVYTFTRTGMSIENIEIPNIFVILTEEFDFAKHYSYCLEFSNRFNPLRYFIWLITLPIPFGDFGGMGLNSEYSRLYIRAYFGVDYKTIVLPGLFGEGLLLYGEYFFWIHALFIGLIYGFFLRYYSCSEDRRYLGVFFVAQIILSTRGGSQSVIAQFINLGIIMFFKGILLKKECKLL